MHTPLSHAPPLAEVPSSHSRAVASVHIATTCMPLDVVNLLIRKRSESRNKACICVRQVWWALTLEGSVRAETTPCRGTVAASHRWLGSPHS